MTPDSGSTDELSIEISATPETVWDLLESEERTFDLRPGLVEHRIVETHEDGSHDCVQVYELHGRRFSQKCRAIDYERPTRKLDEVTTADGHRVSLITTFNPIAVGTRLAMQAVVLEPRAGLRRRWIRNRWAGALTASLQRVKAISEGA